MSEEDDGGEALLEIVYSTVIGAGFYNQDLEVVTTDLLSDDWKNIHLNVKRKDITATVGRPINLEDVLIARMRLFRLHGTKKARTRGANLSVLAVEQTARRTITGDHRLYRFSVGRLKAIGPALNRTFTVDDPTDDYGKLVQKTAKLIQPPFIGTLRMVEK